MAPHLARRRRRRETLPRQHPPPLQRRRASRLAPRRVTPHPPTPEDPPSSPRSPGPSPAHSASGGCGPSRRRLATATAQGAFLLDVSVGLTAALSHGSRSSPRPRYIRRHNAAEMSPSVLQHITRVMSYGDTS